MAFTSLVFYLFLAAVLVVYWVVPRKARAPWLLAASYAFCLSFSGIALAVLLFTTLVSWAAALRIGGCAPPHRRRWLAAGVAVTLAPLVFFKYYDVWVGLSGPLLARVLPPALYQTFVNLLAPVGLSFYTFQLVGYLVDVYRGRQPAERSLLRYALYAAFFPKLIQGPIERTDNLLAQVKGIEALRAFDWDRLTAGAYEVLWGLFLKMVLADRLAAFADPIFGNVAAYGSVQLIAASLGYTLQLYLDFSGYMYIAQGVARCFGFTLLDNFAAPYFASSTGDFWRRWHISLSRWLRDYVYIPLGGSRAGRARRLGNILAVMLLSGVWHGSTWNFVVWGLLHGLYQVAGVLTRPARQALYQKYNVRTGTFGFRLGQRLCTFCLVSFAWIFFRAATLPDALTMVARIATRWNPWVLFDGSFTAGWAGVEGAVFWLGLALVLCADILREKRGAAFPAWLQGQNLPFRWAVCLGLAAAVAVFGMYGVAFDASQFLYFQF